MKAMTCTRLAKWREPLYVGQMRWSALATGEYGLKLIDWNLENKAHTPNGRACFSSRTATHLGCRVCER